MSWNMPCTEGCPRHSPSHPCSNPLKPRGSWLSLTGPSSERENRHFFQNPWLPELCPLALPFFQLLKLFLMRMPPWSRSQCELAKRLLEHIFQVGSQGERCSLGNTPEQGGDRKTLSLWNPALALTLGHSLTIYPTYTISKLHSRKSHGLNRVIWKFLFWFYNSVWFWGTTEKRIYQTMGTRLLIGLFIFFSRTSLVPTKALCG